MARLSACFAIFLVCCSPTFAFGAPHGAKANDLLALDMQEKSVKAVISGTNIFEALNKMAERLDKGSPEPTKMTCPECPELSANVTCPICPKPQCPDLPDNGTILQDQVNITCPESLTAVTTISCPEPIQCPECPEDTATLSCPEPVICPTSPEPTTRTNELTSLPVDCYEYRKRGFVESGIYKIYPLHYSIEGPFEVFCDMETDGGGWTVFQKRGDFGEPKQDFYLNWADYKKGFGHLKREFWLGNDYLFALTNQKRMRLRIDLEDWEGEERYATYEDFLVRSEEDKYRITFGEYAGNAGNSFYKNNNMSFSTKDRDNDDYRAVHCAQRWRSGWWFYSCTYSNLNGLYLRGSYTFSAEARGVYWVDWKGDSYSLKRSEMKIRPILASD